MARSRTPTSRRSCALAGLILETTNSPVTTTSAPTSADRFFETSSGSMARTATTIPGFISEKTSDQVEYFTRLDNPTLKLTYQMSQNNKFELSQQFNRKWQPYRNASRFLPLEATQNQIAWTAIGPALKWTRIINQ